MTGILPYNPDGKTTNENKQREKTNKSQGENNCRKHNL